MTHAHTIQNVSSRFLQNLKISRFVDFHLIRLLLHVSVFRISSAQFHVTYAKLHDRRENSRFSQFWGERGGGRVSTITTEENILASNGQARDFLKFYCVLKATTGVIRVFFWLFQWMCLYTSRKISSPASIILNTLRPIHLGMFRENKFIKHKNEFILTGLIDRR